MIIAYIPAHKELRIFDDIDIELGPGLTVFTGETGAGKSMIVDAVTACLGYRTSPDIIRSGEKRAIVELLISPLADWYPGSRTCWKSLLRCRR